MQISSWKKGPRILSLGLGLSPLLSSASAFAGNIISPDQAFPLSEIYYEVALRNPERNGYSTVVRDVLRHFEARTNLTFIPKRTNWQGSNAPYYIRFVEAPDALEKCYATVGPHFNVATVTCNIAKSGSLLHEIGHAIGLHHEHERSDRHLYVNAGTCPPYIWDLGAGPVLVEEFEVRQWPDFASPAKWIEFQYGYCPIAGQPFGGYDFNSMMHYARFPKTDFWLRPKGSQWGWQSETDVHFTERSGNWMVGSDKMSWGDIATIAYLYPVNGTFLHQSGSDLKYGNNHLLPGNFKKIMQSGNRIGALTHDGLFYAKQGIHGAWHGMHNEVVDFDLEGDRVGVLLNDKSLWVKEGPLGENWLPLHHDVAAFDLEGNRIGVLRPDHVFDLKEGGLSDIWVVMATGATKIQLEDLRIGFVGLDRVLYVKEGLTSALWVPEMPEVANFLLEDDIIIVRDASDTMHAKKGNLSASWKSFGPIKKVVASGERLAYTNASGELFVTGDFFYNNPDLAANGVNGDLFFHGSNLGYIPTSGGNAKVYDVITKRTDVVAETAVSYGR